MQPTLIATSSQPAPQLSEPTAERWQLLRAGLQNIWEYDDQRFVFHRGRLLLRGGNESGKTKALEVLLPFLLDADLSPQRLDPFGSTSRPMRWNLLNENNPGETTRIGYVWIEFGRQGPEGPLYCTIGAGLRAKRTTTGVESWYFVTAQRVDRDLHILGKDRVPLSRKQLAEAMDVAGVLCENKIDYRRMVNQKLFAMPDEQYSALIDTLLQLRRPQLSKALQPDELSRILTASLPPLDMAVVGRLAEGFERLDRHRAEREEFKRALEEVRGFLRVYQRYVKIVARSRAQEMTRADSAFQRARGNLRQARKDHELALEQQSTWGKTIAELEARDEILGERIQTLRGSDEYRAVQELDQIEKLAHSHAEQAGAARSRLEREHDDRDRHQQRLRQVEQDIEQRRRALADARAAAIQAARDAAFEPAHRAVDALVEANDTDAARSTLESLLLRRDQGIASLQAAAKRVAQAEKSAERALGQHRDASDRAREAEISLEQARIQETLTSERFVQDVEAWADEFAVLELDPQARAELSNAPLDDMRAFIERQAVRVRTALDERATELRDTQTSVLRRLDATRAERDELASATHQRPSAPAWRPERPLDRPGAPLYLLCDFRDQDPAIQAGIEAALEASGLLDAWVTPEGAVLDRDTFDVLFEPAPRSGQAAAATPVTLADMLEPVEAGGVTQPVIERVLRTIGLASDDAAAPETTAWVSADGRWRVGPLVGAWRKEGAVFVGATARERERARRLAELERALAELGDEARTLAHELDRLHHRKRALDHALERFPSLRPVVAARARVDVAEENLGRERAAEAQAREAHEQARLELARVQDALHAEASQLGLRPWVNALAELRDATHAYRVASQSLLQEAVTLASRRIVYEERLRAVEDATDRVRRVEEEVHSADSQARSSEAQAAALREAVGATREELLTILRESERDKKQTRGDLKRARDQKSGADQQAGEAHKAAAVASEHVEEAATARTKAEQRFKEFAASGLLSVASLDTEGVEELAARGAPAAWTLTDALVIARQVDAATDGIEYSGEVRDRAENKVNARYQELARNLPAGIRVLPQRAHGVLEYQATLNGRSLEILDLSRELEEEVIAHDRLLDTEERELFESFLAGETHEHLRERLRQAHSLVERMNAQLEICPTASGRTLRLRWAVTEDAPAGTAEAIDLLLRAGHLLSEANRSALHVFLQERLDAARQQDGAGKLLERMLQVLDYRSWFGFTIEYRDPDSAWKKLTRKVHSAGSGGQKAAMLHLPLFAAAAAFYASAAEIAPRLIVLDEAFAGIDPKIRAQLMALLVAFDLDFLMTSYEEWGFFEELDGLSTYHLAHHPGLRGVYTDWFLWNGSQAVEMGAG